MKKHYWKFCILIAWGIFGIYSNDVYAATITTVTVKEKAGVTTTNYPLTFGHAFKKGDVPDLYLLYMMELHCKPSVMSKPLMTTAPFVLQ